MTIIKKYYFALYDKKVLRGDESYTSMILSEYHDDEDITCYFVIPYCETLSAQDKNSKVFLGWNKGEENHAEELSELLDVFFEEKGIKVVLDEDIYHGQKKQCGKKI